MMLEAPYNLKTRRDLVLSIISTAVDFKNFNVLAAIIKYVEQAKLDIYAECMTPFHMIMKFR